MKPVEDQSPEVLTAVQIFGNSLRVAVVRQLYSGPKHRSDIVKAVDASQVSVSHQLQYLGERGLTQEEVVAGRGRPIVYSLNRQRLDSLLDALTTYIRGAQ
ncbi:ArsR/SmtB family transcription factor [Rothia koreensis]|uniref:ArsR/SmtB family transcription factor n=1 Tax=Rothia koreensis TaxID=592378 RepID=UPI0037C9F65C